MLRLGAAVLALASVAAACSDDDGSAGGSTTTSGEAATTTAEATTTSVEPTTTTEAPADVTPAALEGPVTIGERTGPADPRPADLDAAGYVTEEFFAAGTATSYTSEGELSPDGVWDALPGETAEYKTRIVVHRPADPADFSGTVVMEWFNVSAVEASPAWSYFSSAVIDAGAAYVGVSAQALGVVGGDPLIDTGQAEQQSSNTGGIVDANPERYGTLTHPGDRFSFDIWTQVAAALRSPGGVPVLGGAEPSHVIAVGESQSAAFITSYVNAVQPLTSAFDGFLVYSRGAGAAGLDGSPRVVTGDASYRIRTDLDVPVLQFETETDIERLRFGTARQPDTDLVRTWEVPGTAHADAYLVGGEFAACPYLINQGPHHYVVKAAIAALIRWVEEGTAPPSAPPIDTTGDGTTVVRDEHGNATGGIRTPSVEVPVATLTGQGDPDAPPLCGLFGKTVPFDAEKLTALYGTQDAYLRAFDEALDAAVDAGFVRPEDRDAYAAEARAVDFPS